MRPIDERVLAILQAAPGPHSSAALSFALNTQYPPGYSTELLNKSLRRLELEGAAIHAGRDLWRAVGQVTVTPLHGTKRYPIAVKVTAPAMETIREDNAVKAQVKTCNKCGGTSFFPSGGCRNCQAANDERRRKERAALVAKQREKAQAKPTLQPDPKPVRLPEPVQAEVLSAPVDPNVAAGVISLNESRKRLGLPPLDGAQRLVRNVVMLTIKDADGELHSLFFTPETIKQLAIELQEYI